VTTRIERHGEGWMITEKTYTPSFTQAVKHVLKMRHPGITFWIDLVVYHKDERLAQVEFTCDSDLYIGVLDTLTLDGFRLVACSWVQSRAVIHVGSKEEI